MIFELSNWMMRRLLSINRDAAVEIYGGPKDGRKWTISALAFARNEHEAIAWIDEAFWPGHCEQAYVSTVIGVPLETTTPRAKRGARRVIWKLIRNWRNLPKPRATETVQ